MPENMLFYGDNLKILREYIEDDSIDLIYLDPPFQSGRNYNVLFQEQDGTRAAAQIQAFEDTWQWNQESEAAHIDVVQAGGQVSLAMQAFRTFLGSNTMMAYLAMMAPRLVQLRQVLKPTGSIYLHCDPTASHYLKMLMDAIFGPERFQAEITWKRSSAHSDTKQGRKVYGHLHDTILFYTKGSDWTWNPIYTPYDASYLEGSYRHVSASGRRYKETDLTAAKPGGDTEYEWRVKRKAKSQDRWEADIEDEYTKPKSGMEYRGVRPYQGRFWAYSKANLIEFCKHGKLIHRETGAPRLMQFKDEMPGVSLQDVWTDIPPELGANNLGYPTQKPEALLDRILQASSNPDDTVLDPFCGCGTAIVSAQRLGRRWLGIDITHLAITLVKNRLRTAFGNVVDKTYRVVGEPVSIADAIELAHQDRFQFQWWALSLVGACPAASDQKKGKDKGIDGRLYFFDEKTDKPKLVIFSIKSGGVKSGDVRDLRGVIEREKAALGVLVTLEEPSRDMMQEAVEAAFYVSPINGKKTPRLQILTVAELFDGKRPELPPNGQVVALPVAPRAKARRSTQREMFGGEGEGESSA